MKTTKIFITLFCLLAGFNAAAYCQTFPWDPQPVDDGAAFENEDNLRRGWTQGGIYELSKDVIYDRAMPLMEAYGQHSFSLKTSSVAAERKIIDANLKSAAFQYTPKLSFRPTVSNEHFFSSVIIKNGVAPAPDSLLDANGGGAYGNFHDFSSLELNKQIKRVVSFYDVIFASNTASGEDSLGGAVYIRTVDFATNEYDSAVVNFAGGTVFSGNTAGYAGGGYAALGSSIKTLFGVEKSSDVIIFDKNTAVNGNGGGIYASGFYKNELVFNSEIVFTSNTAGMNGGALYKDTDNNLVFGTASRDPGDPYSNVSFRFNNAGNSGGAVYVTGKQIRFHDGSDISFNTAAINGGGIYKGGSDFLEFGRSLDNGLNTIFSSNKALSGSGGGIYSESGLISFLNAYTEFSSNYAGVNGGGIYKSSGGDISFWNVGSVAVIFKNNEANRGSGGGIYSGGGTISFNNSPLTEFISNTAGIGGGGIYSLSGALNFNADDTLFHGNRALAGAGGGIYSAGTDKMLFSGNVYFTSNTAAAGGGAVYSKTNNLIFSKEAVFRGNETTVSGGNGGAIFKDSYFGEIKFSSAAFFSDNKSAGAGGAIYSGGGDIIFSDSVIFTSNTSVTGGGAVCNGLGNVDFLGNAVFEGNAARGDQYSHGGAISFGGSVPNYINFVKAEFTRNYASGKGGAVYGTGGSIKFNNDIFFTSNTATSGGGGLFTVNSKVDFDKNASFTANKADGSSNLSSGGAIYAENSEYIFSQNTCFNSNATDFARGGAVHAKNSIFTFENYGSNVTYFKDNTTSANNPEGGAAVYASGSRLNFYAYNTYFVGNKTLGYTSVSGGAVYLLDSDAYFNTAYFFENTATSAGGAMAVVDSSATFYYDVMFQKNQGASGGAVYAGGSDTSKITFARNVFFEENSATSRDLQGGGALLMAATAGTHQVFFGNDKVLQFTYNSAESGGAVSVYSSALNELYMRGATVFSSNTARSHGGAIHSFVYDTGGAGKFYLSKEGIFSFNKAGVSGGAIYAEGNNIFNIGAYRFINNVSFGTNESGGGAIYSAGGTFVFNASSDTYTNWFSGNTAASRGGAVYQSSSSFLFSNKTVFSESAAGGSGGAVYASSGSMIFDDEAIFDFNTADGDTIISGGGAFYLTSSANVVFSSGTQFSANKALGTSVNGSGGAVYSSESSAVFGTAGSGSFAYFVNNEARNKGGAVYQSGGKTVFNSSSSFVSNKAYSGGALYASGADIAFNDETLFYANKAGGNINGSGGAFYQSNGKSVFAKSADFISNEANTDGGAIYVSGGTIEFSTPSSFSGNKALAGSGGAAAVTGKSSITLNDALVSGNSAALNGGAFYLKGLDALNKAEIHFNQVNEVLLSFAGNTAGGASNAVHFAGNSSFEMNIAQNSVFNMIDGISAEGINNAMKIQGGGTFNLTGKFLAYNAVNLEVSGINFNLKQGAVLRSGSLSVKSSGNLDACNSVADTISVAGDFTVDSNSTVKLDVFADGTTDVIEVGGSAYLDGNLLVKAGIGTYDNKWFSLVLADGGFNNSDFYDKSANVTGIDPANPCNLKYEFEYSKDGKNLMLVVNGIRRSNFSAHAETKNQKNIAAAIDSFSSAASRPMANVLNGISGLASAQQKDALSQKTPHFIANVINAQIQTGNRGIYNQIAENKKSEINIWGHAIADSVKFSGTKESIGDFSGTNYGLMAGADRYMEDIDVTIGIFGSYVSQDMEQQSSKADAASTGCGIYGVMIKEKWEIKGSIDFALQDYETKRNIYIPDSAIDSTASADFSGYTYGADIESAYKHPLSEIFTLKPYAGLSVSAINYDGFTEKGADTLDLDVEGGNMTASNVRLGVGVNGKIESFGFGAQLEYNYLMSGYEPEIKSSLYGTDTYFKTYGAEIGRNLVGLNLGADYGINEDLKVYAGGMYKVGSDFSELYGNLGLRYSFK